jgi:uncharacterized small protein (DUF1192 family)
MRGLSQSDCLTLWESGRTLHPIDQGLLAVQTAFPETRDESVADWPLGRRNRALAELHVASFGRSLRGWTTCAQCAEKLEFEVDGETLAAMGVAEVENRVALGQSEFRLPTSRDLAHLAAQPEAADAALLLLERCRLDRGRQAGAPLDLNEQEIEEVGSRLALADPLAEILLDFNCPVCGESFQESLELASFLWAELEARARRLLLDVHTLASAYGWGEAEILGLSAARREFYLEMVSA